MKNVPENIPPRKEPIHTCTVSTETHRKALDRINELVNQNQELIDILRQVRKLGMHNTNFKSATYSVGQLVKQKLDDIDNQ